MTAAGQQLCDLRFSLGQVLEQSLFAFQLW